MAFGSFDDKDAELSEINVTPLVDVMLVLLIVFMLAIPAFTSSIDIQLPKSSTQKQDEQVNLVTLLVNSEGKYYYQDKETELTEIETFLAEMNKTSKNLVIAIRADKAADYGFVVALLQAVKKAGVSKVGFVTEKE